MGHSGTTNDFLKGQKTLLNNFNEQSVTNDQFAKQLVDGQKQLIKGQTKLAESTQKIITLLERLVSQNEAKWPGISAKAQGKLRADDPFVGKKKLEVIIGEEEEDEFCPRSENESGNEA